MMKIKTPIIPINLTEKEAKWLVSTIEDMPWDSPPEAISILRKLMEDNND